jgi:hypothetical protein
MDPAVVSVTPCAPDWQRRRRQGFRERVTAQTTGHKSMTVLRWYIREGDMFRENAASAESYSNPFRRTSAAHVFGR